MCSFYRIKGYAPLETAFIVLLCTFSLDLNLTFYIRYPLKMLFTFKF